MANNSVNIPSSAGGLVRFKEEYKSRFTLKPAHVVGFVILIVFFRLSLQLFFK